MVSENVRNSTSSAMALPSGVCVSVCKPGSSVKAFNGMQKVLMSVTEFSPLNKKKKDVYSMVI